MELVDTPAQFGGKLLSEMDDIIVGEILQEKKGSVVTIGNKDFSVGLLLEDGKIFCSKQDQLVDVEPGELFISQNLGCNLPFSSPFSTSFAFALMVLSHSL